jgi:glyceraldehyde 3-phosphate dehydrogenase
VVKLSALNMVMHETGALTAVFAEALPSLEGPFRMPLRVPVPNGTLVVLNFK